MSSTSQHLCAYVSQNDLHHPEMTVRETINFASNMLGANNEFGMSAENDDLLSRKQKHPMAHPGSNATIQRRLRRNPHG
uniref:Uncharacterized protein n=1 Tax=Zea mays TaxID=4577 RepID=C4J376_MAIZE|nr:unknown [Zea mays]